MKTLSEIIQKYREDPGGWESMFGFQYDDLLEFIPYEQAKEFLKDDVDEDKFNDFYRELSRETVIQQMKDYMSFAWEKCCSQRGLSASRSLAHYHAWLWILEDQDTINFLIDPNNYACYGAPVLRKICEVYSWNFIEFVLPWQKSTAVRFAKGKGCV